MVKMGSFLLAGVLVAGLCGVSAYAEPDKKKATPPPSAEKSKPEEKKSDKNEKTINRIVAEMEQDEESEMGVFRSLLAQKKATRKDLYNIFLMQSGQFAQMPKPIQRLDWIKARDKSIRTEADLDVEITRGEVARFLHKNGKYEKGMMYSLTGLERYAFRDMVALGIMASSSSSGDKLSGAQLMGVFELAEKVTVTKKTWPRVEEVPAEAPDIPERIVNADKDKLMKPKGK